MTNFCLHDEQTVNELRKIAWASVFGFSFERQYVYGMCVGVWGGVCVCVCIYIHIYVHIYIYIYMCTYVYSRYILKLLFLFSVCSKQTEISVCLLQMKNATANFSLFAANGNGKQNFVFLGQQTINGNRQLLFQQSWQCMLLANTLIPSGNICSQL